MYYMLLYFFIDSFKSLNSTLIAHLTCWIIVDFLETRYIVRIGFRDLNFGNVPIVNIKMASKKVFDLMEAENWNEVMELLTNTAWTSQDLEEKHGVRSII